MWNISTWFQGLYISLHSLHANSYMWFFFIYPPSDSYYYKPRYSGVSRRYFYEFWSEMTQKGAKQILTRIALSLQLIHDYEFSSMFLLVTSWHGVCVFVCFCCRCLCGCYVFFSYVMSCLVLLLFCFVMFLYLNMWLFSHLFPC